jgi:hypothetical protein
MGFSLPLFLLGALALLGARMSWRILILGLVFSLALLGTVGCRAEPPSPTESTSVLASGVASTPVREDTTSPLPQPEGFQRAEPASLNGPVFSLDEPLHEGATEVTGSGPQGIPISIADLTLMGESLGRGSVGPDGRFTIPVTPPLIVNHRIGILLDDQTTGFYFSEEILAQLEALRGDNAITVPRIGTAYDAASVKP